MSDKPFFFDFDYQTLKAQCTSFGLPEFRAQQLWRAFYIELASSIEDVTTLSRELRQRLAAELDFSHLSENRRLVSSDQETVKTLFELPDGKAIESVLMQYEERHTLCISTQVGCAMGCVFCATGQMGFSRNLSAGEIVEQVIQYARELKHLNQVVTNVVIMGMGEPFHNYDAVLSAIGILNDPQGFNLGARRFTISTVGLIPAIERFSSEKNQINLAISLHAANDELRSTLIPVARKYPLSDLIKACNQYIERTHRRLTFEWALIQGVNDRDRDAEELASLIQGMLCHVNIIPLNPTEKFAGKSTTRERASAFQAILSNHGIPCTIRLRRGIDIQAGCGQLASRHSQTGMI